MGKTAFDAKRLNAFAFDPDRLVIIGVDTTDDDTHPLYDPRVEDCVEGNEDFEALVESVAAHGILQPIRVFKDATDPKYPCAIVVDGRRRVLAARAAAMRTSTAIAVPAVRQSEDEDKALFASMVTANELRVDDDPMAKAAKLERFVNNHGASMKDAALAFGVTEQTIRNWKRLLRLSPKVRAAVSAGKIKATAAGKLANLAPIEQDARLAELLRNGKKATVKAAEAKAASRTQAPPKRFLQKLVAFNGEHDVSPEFLAGVRYAIGDRSAPLPGDTSEALKALVAAVEACVRS